MCELGVEDIWIERDSSLDANMMELSKRMRWMDKMDELCATWQVAMR